MKGIEKPKDSAEFERDQKHPAYRKSLKKWIESGIDRHAARYVAREEARKPSAN
jgi:hypothetical protein